MSQPDTRPDSRRRISPTDISQYIRLDQCRRYLALRLRERAEGRQMFYDYGVSLEAISPLLSRTGYDFERRIETAIGQNSQGQGVAAGKLPRPTGRSFNHNQAVIDLARSLKPGQQVVYFQTRLEVEVAGWEMRGDLDILRLERDEAGQLQAMIADMKSSASPRLEYRLQVAFYQIMLETLFNQAGLDYAPVKTAILYRGPSGDQARLTPAEQELLTAHQLDAYNYFGLTESYLEVVADQQVYLEEVYNLVTGPQSEAWQTWQMPLEETGYHLNAKCDGCLYNPFCMKSSAEREDLSLLPHLTPVDKEALRRNGITSVSDLAALKELRRPDKTLAVSPGQEAVVRRLAVTWPVGPRVDELVHRARRYRQFKGDQLEALSYIPSKGHGSLPYADATHNPNLVRIYLDAQHDYLTDRIYLLGALVAGCEAGQPHPQRRRSVVRLAGGPPDLEQEAALLKEWIDETLRAVVEVAAPDAEGRPNAPLHLIFFDRQTQKVLLDGLSRHLNSILGATPLYDFLTQLAAFDSPVASYLEHEIRELKNYPMVCQSLTSVAAFLKFDWRQGEDYRKIFRARVFDIWGKLDEPEAGPVGGSAWYTSHARFSSALPLEYAYAAWDELEPTSAGQQDLLAPFRTVNRRQLEGFAARRLEALEHITADFRGNHLTEKRPFQLPDLAGFKHKARTLAHAIEEFTTIERHVEMNAWKAARNLAPERRLLMGETLLARYLEADQPPEVAERNRHNTELYLLQQQFRAEYEAANPGQQVRLPKEHRARSDWSQEGMVFRLRLETEAAGCSPQEALALTNLREGDTAIMFKRWTVDERLPQVERTLNTPTPKQMLYGLRVTITRLAFEPDTGAAFVEIKPNDSRGASESYVFPVMRKNNRPPEAGELYTLDPDINNWYSYWCAVVARGLCDLEEGRLTGVNALYERLVRPGLAQAVWPDRAEEGQRRFVDGLLALNAAGGLHDFETGKLEYIGGHGRDATLLVQGPPGTGKSYTTAFALLARLQGAMAAGLEFRALLSCKTHAATDVLLANVRQVQVKLGELQARYPDLFARYFDARLLEVPLYRIAGKTQQPEGIIELVKDTEKPKGDATNRSILGRQRWCVAGATPGGIYGMRDTNKDKMFRQQFCQCLVLDEASQMNLPEAALAALALEPGGQLIVVGDHRQMPPIVKHDWESEPRRTFQQYKSYQSLFESLLALDPPPAMIKFERSFRLHATMAEFLRREIYAQDGINYYSAKLDLLQPLEHNDPFVAAALHPDYPIIVVTHTEGGSQTRNLYEQQLVGPLLEALAGRYGLDAGEGLGVVVPHRAQRAALKQRYPALLVLDPETGEELASAVDTVERFQGGERQVMLISATESDRDYLLQAGQFLYDPRRLTVAISRAKRKLILVASRSIFTLFSPDEEAFANGQLWKNLLRRTCTIKLWEGEVGGQTVEVWGNQELS